MGNVIKNIVNEKSTTFLGKDKMIKLVQSLQDMEVEFSHLNEEDFKELVEATKEKVKCLSAHN